MSGLPSLLLQGSSSLNTCRPDNPINSLAKNLQDDRSNQRDRLQASSTSSTLGSVEGELGHSNLSTNHLINLQLDQEQLHHQPQPFDQLENLSRNLNRIQLDHHPIPRQNIHHHHHPPHHQNWSNAFLRSTPIHELLQPKHPSFSTISSDPNRWKSEFVKSHHHHQPDHLHIKSRHHSLVQHQPTIQSSLICPRLPFSNFQHHQPSIPSHIVSQVPPIEHLDSSTDLTDWDAAYLKYDHDLSSKITGVAQLDDDRGKEQIAHHYIARSHSPINSSSPDALAKTAASLIATVENGQQAQNSHLVDQPLTHESSTDIDSTVEKFNQSSFMDFMRKLRDGEVKVEGDKVVQQLAPISRSTPSIDHQNQTHQQPIDHTIQQSSGLYSTPAIQSSPAHGYSRQEFDPPAESNGNLVHLQDSLVSKPHPHDQALQAYRGDLEDRMKEMNELMEEADAELEHAQYRAQMNRFQGDGGAISELDEILNAASEVDRPQKQDWTNTNVPGATEGWVEEFDQPQTQTNWSEEKDDQVEFDEMGMFGRPLTARELELERLKRIQRAPSSQQLEWEKFQNQWENMGEHRYPSMTASETISTISPAVHLERMEALGAQTGYKFQQANPLIFRSDRTKHHSTHEPWGESIIDQSWPNDPQSILQKEKEVLEDPDSASAWYSLGVKQQENEREDLAIEALRQAIKLDPELSDAVLALAISYTNENRRAEAFEEIEKWIQVESSKVPHYRRAMNSTSHQTSQQTQPSEFGGEAESLKSRHERLTNQLLALARLGGRIPGTASVDPDVQIALGVLFNSNDEFQKACDCFSTALAVRPDDPLLFNRLGATLANSGQPEEAIEYYHKAIELLPTYIRARYNLSISLINLGKYFESIKVVLGAMSIQEQGSNIPVDSTPHDSNPINRKSSGVTSAVLWQTLEVNCSLLRNRFSTDTQKELDECFNVKNLSSLHKILSEYL